MRNICVTLAAALAALSLASCKTTSNNGGSTKKIGPPDAPTQQSNSACKKGDPLIRITSPKGPFKPDITGHVHVTGKACLKPGESLWVFDQGRTTTILISMLLKTPGPIDYSEGYPNNRIGPHAIVLVVAGPALTRSLNKVKGFGVPHALPASAIVTLSLRDAAQTVTA